MSIENAILELAAAINNLAASNVGQLQADLKKSQMMVGVHLQEAMSSGRELAEMKAATPADTIEQDVAKVKTDAKAEQKKVMAQVEADRKPSTAKEAIADALAKAKAEKEAAAKKAESETATQNAQSQGAGQDSDDPLDAVELDWDKDVRPALLAVGKDRDALVKLMAKYDVPKGGKAPTEKWADLLAEANDIVAARG